jgi:hypothetical protein
VSVGGSRQIMIVSQITYANAEVRGQLRQWKKKLAKDYTTFSTAMHAMACDAAPTPLGDMMFRKSKVGRERALAKLHKSFGPGVVLECSRLEGKHPLAVWSILNPREAVTVLESDFPDDKLRGSLLQDCVVLNYVIAGFMPDTTGIAEGAWSIEVPDHALGRAVERSRLLHPGTLIREAHANLLAAPATALKHLSDTGQVDNIYVKAGPGCFVGGFLAAPDLSADNEINLHFRVATWLHDDQLRDDQIPLARAESGLRLGNSWLTPRPFCYLDESEGTVKPAIHEWWPAG